MLIPGLSHRTSTHVLQALFASLWEGMVATKARLETMWKVERLLRDLTTHSGLLHNQELRLCCV